ncbi:aspartic peptidase domain-containing protein, partial [Mycena vulgaris]
VNVILDTGGTDMWYVMINPSSIGPFTDTGVYRNIAYGEGKTYINGTIGLTEVEFAGHKIPSQGFKNECKINGICGLVGLGFDSPTSGIRKALTAVGKDGAAGKSVLSNVFDMNPAMGRFFAFSLSRLGDKIGSADASLNIGEYDEKYADVEWEAKRPVFPATGKNWRILSDGMSVDGVSIPWTANSNSTPSGQKLVGLETGTSNILLKAEIVSAIYSAIPGAVLAKNSSLRNTHWSADNDVWVVPCNASSSLTAYFEGHPYPIHPLDLTDLIIQRGPDNTEYTICVGTITNGGTITSGDVDGLYGDSFLRNVYTVFSYGDNTTAPYIQFLSQTNEWQARNDFQRVRNRRLAKSPPEIAPADLVQLFDGPSSGTSSNSSGSSSSSTDSSSGTDSESLAAKYGPAVIGLLAVNLVVLLILVFLGVMSFIRGGRNVRQTRALNPQYAPVRVKDD